MRMRDIVLGTLIIAASVQFAGATSSVYPSRPITVIVPFGAGGPADTLHRILAERMRISLGQPIVIDNVGGAAGRVGTGRVARAVPDGYTLVAGSAGTHMANGAIYTLNYDVLTDFEPVALLAATPQLIVSKKTIPANNLQSLIGWLKMNPDVASQGTSGVSGYSHIAGVLFQKETGTRFQFVFYRSGAQTMQDLVAGRIDLMIDQASNALPQIRGGTIKAYAVAANTRLAEAPDVPTVDEAGLPKFHFSHWYAFFAPKGTPATLINRLYVAAAEALDDPAVRQRLTELGLQIYPREQQTPKALAVFQRTEIEKWWPVIKAAGIKAD
jgi:tripartite-type tricarboxylate transporter receptor subunit TctC